METKMNMTNEVSNLLRHMSFMSVVAGTCASGEYAGRPVFVYSDKIGAPCIVVDTGESGKGRYQFTSSGFNSNGVPWPDILVYTETRLRFRSATLQALASDVIGVMDVKFLMSDSRLVKPFEGFLYLAGLFKLNNQPYDHGAFDMRLQSKEDAKLLLIQLRSNLAVSHKSTHKEARRVKAEAIARAAAFLLEKTKGMADPAALGAVQTIGFDLYLIHIAKKMAKGAKVRPFHHANVDKAFNKAMSKNFEVAASFVPVIRTRTQLEQLLPLSAVATFPEGITGNARPFGPHSALIRNLTADLPPVHQTPSEQPISYSFEDIFWAPEARDVFEQLYGTYWPEIPSTPFSLRIPAKYSQRMWVSIRTTLAVAQSHGVTRNSVVQAALTHEAENYLPAFDHTEEFELRESLDRLENLRQLIRRGELTVPHKWEAPVHKKRTAEEEG